MKIKHYCPLYGEVEIEILDDVVQKAVEKKIDSKIMELEEKLKKAAKARMITEQ